MSNTVIGKIVMIGVLITLVTLAFIFIRPTGRVYDCGMAEWHPDIPINVKEECRRLRYEYWQQEQESKGLTKA